MAPAAEPGDRMTFRYFKDVDVDGRGVPRTVMRPRISIRINNVRPAKQGGSDEGYGAEALADSGADTTFITREVADLIDIDLDALNKVKLTTPFGRFEVYRTLVRIEVIYRGRRIDLGKTPASIPEKDTMRLGGRPFIVAGRLNIFSQYTIKFDDYREILTMKRIARE